MLFIWVLPSLTSKGQTTSGQVLNRRDSQPIPYANIIKSGFREGTFTDEEGFFSLRANSTDSLFISAIGYKPAIISVSEVILHPVIKLEESVTELEAVIVKPSRQKPSMFEVGYQKSKKHSRLVTKKSGFQVATYIANPVKDEAKTEFISAFIAIVRSPRPARIRLRVYSVSSFMSPLKDVLTESIVLDIHSKTGKLVVNLRERNIILPKEGIIAAIEIIGNLDKNGKIMPPGNTPIEAYVMLSKDDEQRNTWIGFMNRSWSREVFSQINNSNCNAMMGFSIESW